MSKTVLLDAAKSESRYLNKLHQLGILLGITEWVQDFHTKLLLPLTPEVPSQSLADGEDLLENSELMSDSSSKASKQDADNDGDRNDVEDDADADDEDLYELASVMNEEGNSSVDSKEEDEKGQGVEVAPEGHSDGEQLSQQRAIIEDIRKNEFGVGVELNEAGQNLMKKQQARLGRSLERLSTELYSKETHFVLELIQNADDNSYTVDRKEDPALAFVVQKDCVTILNNECGFEEKNVRAICDVGKSTKGKHTCGYIGQKGIGFKSVFKVTDCPEIHSNDFHIKFDKKDAALPLPGVDWVLLDSCYLRDGDLSGWRDFLSDLGVRDLLIFRKERRTLRATELASCPWAAKAEMWPKTSDQHYIIEDQQCEELHSLITADQLPPDIKLQQRQALVNLLENKWDTGYSYTHILYYMDN
ncbi:hypothetical protein C0J45_6613 [Silurus meridionalis]|nr:hypothetical protein C0J45_6613 [Silurus meridionalis]